MGFVHAPCMKFFNQNPEDLRSQVPDESHTGEGEGEVRTSSQNIKTVKPDGHNIMEDASSEEAFEDVQEWSAPENQKLTHEFHQVESNLPETLRGITALFPESHEKLMVLYGLVSSIGCVAPLSFVVYNDRKNYPSLFCLMLMPPASGKGVISLVQKLYYKIHETLSEGSNLKLELYRAEMQQFKKKQKKGESCAPPLKPPQKLLYIPGNTTSSMMVQILNDTDGKQLHLLFEMETDSVSAMWSSEHFKQNSIIFRKAYHNEPVSQARKTNYEVLSCKLPKLSMILTGTPSQAVRLLRSASDGLVSRFMVLFSNPAVKWKDVSPSGTSLDDIFTGLGEKIFNIWEQLKKREIEVTLSQSQWKEINSFGSMQLPKVSEFLGEDAGSIPKRHANMAVRIALVLTVLRIYEEQIESNKVECSDVDFKTALWIMEMSYASAIKLFKSLPDSEKSVKVGNEKHQFYQSLPENFSFKQIKDRIKELGIADRTANRYLRSLLEAGLLKKIRKGEYQKIN